MKGLLDIQQDIRNLETDLEDITERLKSLNSDIEEIRNTSATKGPDYKQIEMLAQQFSFGRHPINKMDAGICRIYLEMLLNIVHLDSETEMVIDRLVFIQWLQIESGLEWSLEDLYKDSLKMNQNTYYEFSVVPVKYRESFLVDALIVANIGGKANREILEYIADVNVILGVPKSDLKMLSIIAQISLCQNVNNIDRKYLADIQNWTKNYRHYIRLGLVKLIKIALRDVVVELKDEEVENFKWKIKQGSAVHEGDLVATYQHNTGYNGWNVLDVHHNIIHSYDSETKEIKATSSGTIYQFRDNNTNYGVISVETDDKASIKAWVKANREEMI